MIPWLMNWIIFWIESADFFFEFNNILNWILGKAILNRILNESFFWQNSKIELNQIGYQTVTVGSGVRRTPLPTVLIKMNNDKTIAQVLLRQSFQGAIAVYSTTTLLATVCCLLLPIETKDREMGGSKGWIAQTGVIWQIKIFNFFRSFLNCKNPTSFHK